MEEIHLKDICDLDNGYAFKSDDYVDNSNTLNCRMSNIRPDGSFDILYSAKYLPNEFAEKFKDYILHDGDLIIAMTDMAGDPKILGVPTVVDTQGFCLLLNQRVGRLRFIREGVNADYLKLALQCPKVRTYLKRFAGGGVQLNVSKKDILSVPVCMRNEEEQNHIAGLFKRVLEVKTKREQELQLLDNLIKARFVEMFGDMKPTVTIERYIAELRGGKSLAGTEECKNKVLKTGAATFGWFDPEQYKYLPVDYEPLPEHKVETGDVIISRMNTPELVGACSYVFEAPEGMYYPDRLWKVIPQPETNPIFLWQLLWDREIRRQIKEKSGGTSGTMHNISKPKLLEIKCIDAPIEHQNQFADFVRRTDKSKVVVKKALDQAQLLFDSLMQEYFG